MSSEPNGGEPEVVPLNLFSGEPQDRSFPHMTRMFPSSELEPASEPFRFPTGPELRLPDAFVFDGASRDTRAFLESTDTAALVVLRDGSLRCERYWLTCGPEVQWISWSVAKSFISALIGIAIDEGHIASIEDPISGYVPRLRGSAYDGVAIRSVLEMSSGASWNEDYSDPDSDISRFSAAISGGGSMLDFVAGMTAEREPSSFCQYNSADTQALGHMLIAATGRTITDYMQEKLFTPLGMEAPGYWLLDRDGVEMAFGGLNLTARDYAKLGELYRKGGNWNGRQLVPAQWVASSTSRPERHLQTGRVTVGGHVFPLGYAYQWWVPEGDRGEYSAIGVYNQFVYVDPVAGATVVKLSANRRYGLSTEESDNREGETVAFIRAVIAALEREERA